MLPIDALASFTSINRQAEIFCYFAPMVAVKSNTQEHLTNEA